MKMITEAALRQMWAEMGPKGKQDLREQLAPWATDEQFFQMLRRNRHALQVGTGKTLEIPAGQIVQVVINHDGLEKDYGRWRVVVPLTQKELHAYVRRSSRLAYQGDTFCGVLRQMRCKGERQLVEATDRDRARMLAKMRWIEQTDQKLRSNALALAEVREHIAILQDPRAPHYLIDLDEWDPPVGDVIGTA